MTNNKNGTFYLSGGMEFKSDLGASWRKMCSDRLAKLNFGAIDITALDVAYTEAHGEMYRNLGETEVLQRKSNIRQHFIKADINLIRNNTDGVIVLYDESVRLGAGTTSEIHESFMLDIPVFLLNSYKDFSAVPGWMMAQTTKSFIEWEELFQYLEKLPPGIIKKDVYGNRHSEGHYLCSLCGDVELKHKTHFVSKVTPLYCKRCVDVVKTTVESHKDRYEFFMETLNSDKS